MGIRLKPGHSLLIAAALAAVAVSVRRRRPGKIIRTA